MAEATGAQRSGPRRKLSGGCSSGCQLLIVIVYVLLDDNYDSNDDSDDTEDSRQRLRAVEPFLVKQNAADDVHSRSAV